jgi:predicted nuclease of predicted toxin-antitoxin system
MRLLLDESVPHRLRRSLPSHAVRTVGELEWGGIRNGELLARAANEFDALVTVDKNLQYQQNLDALPITVIVLDAKSNELPYLLPLIPKLEEALASLLPRTFVRIGA